jgi:hypothetical protein
MNRAQIFIHLQINVKRQEQGTKHTHTHAPLYESSQMIKLLQFILREVLFEKMSTSKFGKRCNQAQQGNDKRIKHEAKIEF